LGGLVSWLAWGGYLEYKVGKRRDFTVLQKSSFVIFLVPDIKNQPIIPGML